MKICISSFVYRNLVFRKKQSEELNHSRLEFYVVESKPKRSEMVKTKTQILVNQKKTMIILKMSQTLKHTNNPKLNMAKTLFGLREIQI